MKGKNKASRTLALAGNPNVGKSTLFNALTGGRQHTGNWPGKTVETTAGIWRRREERVALIDLPGTYTLTRGSPEEEQAAALLTGEAIDGVILICDATCLERSLILAVQILWLGKPALVCLNLMDEAFRRGITVDSKELERLLGVPVVAMSAGRKKGLSALDCRLNEMTPSPWTKKSGGLEEAVELSERLAAAVTHMEQPQETLPRWDRLLLRREVAWPILLLLLGGVLWITIVGANLPSQLLSDLLLALEAPLSAGLERCSAPPWLIGLLVEGVYRVLAWVVAVMLPPMAIFFPLFTLLEEWGLLPRVAFVADHAFSQCGGCGRQALSLCMSLGCNAVGVSGCRIIEDPRERLVAILTASLVPCNGRFPTLVALSAMFFAGGMGQDGSALLLLGLILLGIAMTLLLSKFLSVTLLRGRSGGFVLELPPFRRPQVRRVVLEALVDRTLFVLSRALLAAAPAGALIWILGNATWGGSQLLTLCTRFLEPVGGFLGLDGVLLMAFLLGSPANEIVLPVALMAYLSTGRLTEWGNLTALHSILTAHGWTQVTALCVLLFSLFHWPCVATCQTIRRETGSWKWTGVAVLLPTICGVVLCALVNLVSKVSF